MYLDISGNNLFDIDDYVPGSIEVSRSEQQINFILGPQVFILAADTYQEGNAHREEEAG